jgi:VWFA-related protein
MKKILLAVLFLVWFGSLCFSQNETAGAKLQLIVTEDERSFVEDLTAEDFAVYIDGKEQTGWTLKRETRPLLYMLAMDNSGSMRFLLDDLIRAGKSVVGRNEPKDLTALMRFVGSDIIETTDKFVSNRAYLERMLDSFYIQRGQTVVVDAAYRAVKMVGDQPGAGEDYRRIVVVISDGEDRASEHKPAQLIELAKEKNVEIFFIGLTSELEGVRILGGGNAKKKTEGIIRNLTEETGGAVVFPGKKDDLKSIVEGLSTAMRTRFVIRFPTPVELTGRKLEIRPSKAAKKRKLKFNLKVLSS